MARGPTGANPRFPAARRRSARVVSVFATTDTNPHTRKTPSDLHQRSPAWGFKSVSEGGNWTVTPRVYKDSWSVPICGFRRLDQHFCVGGQYFSQSALCAARASPVAPSGRPLCQAVPAATRRGALHSPAACGCPA